MPRKDRIKTPLSPRKEGAITREELNRAKRKAKELAANHKDKMIVYIIKDRNGNITKKEVMK
jgi:phage FluMu protein gp41